MATEAKVVESAFRLGAGRYIQEAGAINRIAEELTLIGKNRPFILHGCQHSALVAEKIISLLDEDGVKANALKYEGFCNKEKCERIICDASVCASDSIIAIGGGNVIDAGKIIAESLNLPIITIPTSSATCAAYTPLSVCYNERGQTVGTVHHKREVCAVLVDMDIIATQPARLLISGAYDAMAKLPELNQRLIGKGEHEIDIGLRASYEYSHFIYERLGEILPRAVLDLTNKNQSKELYDCVYISIALTGAISGLARGSNQCAIAHKIYEVSRTLFPEIVRDVLHGELVAIGLILQHKYNMDTEEEAFKENMKMFGMPTSLSELRIPTDEESIKKYQERIEASSALKGASEEEIQRFRESFQAIV